MVHPSMGITTYLKIFKNNMVYVVVKTLLWLMFKLFFVHSDPEERNCMAEVGKNHSTYLQKSKPKWWSPQSRRALQGRSLQRAGVCIKEKRFTAHSALMELRIFNQANSICCGKCLPVFEAGPITGWFDEARPQRDTHKRGNSKRLVEA